MGVLQRGIRYREMAAEASEKLEMMRYVAETEKYLCSSVSRIFSSCTDPEELKKNLEKFFLDHRIVPDFLVWQPSGGIHHATFAWQNSHGNWKDAFLQMQKIVARFYGGAEKDIPADVLGNLRAVFGPHFFPRYYHLCSSGRNLSLLRTDSSLNRPLLWLNVSDRYGLAVFFRQEQLDMPVGLRHFIDHNSGRILCGYIDRTQVVCNDTGLQAEIAANPEKFRQSFKNDRVVGNYYLFTNFIDAGITGFCAARKSDIDGMTSGNLHKMILAIIILWLLAFTWLSFRVVAMRQPLRLKIRRQLILLFFVANSIPAYFLYVLGVDYLQQLYNSRITSVFNRSLAYLQSIDELYGNELTVQKKRFLQHLPQLKAALRQNRIDRSVVRGFLDQQRPAPYRFFLVASDTGIIAGSKGILKHGRVEESFVKGFSRDAVRINTMQAVYKLCHYVLAQLNRQPVSGKAEMEAEFVAESLMQKKPVEVVRQFFERSGFWRWGIGMKKHPTFADMIQLADARIFDYLLLFLWEADELELEFISRIYPNLDRNESGFNIMAVNELFTAAFPPEVLHNNRLKEFALKLRDRTLTSPEFCFIDGEKYMLAGHKCIFMETIRLLALYPVEKIDREIAARQSLLQMLLLASILISVSLGLMMARRILAPLAELQLGIEALRKRDFSYRLAHRGSDEFGYLAGIFAEMLGDLEEMHVASQVQEKLMTQMSCPVDCGCLRIFARTVSLAVSGGDYLVVDIAEAGETCVMLGEPVDRGVATCLQLAFLQAAIIQLQSGKVCEADFFSALDRLLRQSRREKGGSAMRLLHISACGDAGIKIQNAGMPQLWLLDHNCRNIRALPMNTAPLGVIAESSWPLMQIMIPENHSLLAFTGGLSAGWQADEQRLQQLVIQTMSPDPQKFCDSLLDEYFALTNRASCREDISLVIIHHPGDVNNGKADC